MQDTLAQIKHAYAEAEANKAFRQAELRQQAEAQKKAAGQPHDERVLYPMYPYDVKHGAFLDALRASELMRPGELMTGPNVHKDINLPALQQAIKGKK